MYKKRDIVAVDGGFGVFSARNLAGDKVSFRAAAVRLPDEHKDLANWADKTGHWLVGDKAVMNGTAERGSTDTKYYTSEEFRVMFLYALKQLGVKRAAVITGLPQESYRQLKTTHSTNVKSFTSQLTKDNEFSIDLVITIPQVMGSLLSPGLKDYEGKPVDLSRGKVGIIDIGDGTIDGAEAFEGAPNPNVHYGANKGMSDVHKAILRGFKESKKYEIGSEVSVHLIDKWLRDGHFYYRGDEVQMSSIDFVKKALNNYLPEIDAAIKEMWGTGNTLRYIILSGGGPALLGRSRLENVVPKKQLVIPEDPGEANVSGFLEMLRLQLEHKKMISG